jgi:hypothetical protein
MGLNREEVGNAARLLDNFSYKYNPSVQVPGSSKLNKMSFYDSALTAKTLWPTIKNTSSYDQPVIRDHRVWDTNCFVTGSLAMVLKNFKISEQKLDFDHVGVQNQFDNLTFSQWNKYLVKLYPELIQYNERDVTAMALLVNKLVEEFKQLGVPNILDYPTLPNLAKKS